MLEAMATGLPVVHIYDELNKGQVIDGYNGFIYKNSAQMKKIIDNYKKISNDEKNEISKNSRRSVLKFGDITLAKNLLNIYKQARQIYSKPDSVKRKLQLNYQKIKNKIKKQ